MEKTKLENIDWTVYYSPIPDLIYLFDPKSNTIYFIDDDRTVYYNVSNAVPDEHGDQINLGPL